MIRKLHHSAYRCRDSEQTRRFYEDFLGLPLAVFVESAKPHDVQSARKFLKQQLDPKHLDKMVPPMALVARMSEDRGLIAPHVHKLGASHKPYALGPKDLANFKAVFVETLGLRLGAGWSSAAAKGWDRAFEEVIIPLMREGAG